MGGATVAKQREVPSQLDGLSTAIDDLRTAVDLLGGALSPVLSVPSIQEKVTTPEAPESPVCGVAGSIRSARYLIESIVRDVRAFTDRVEV